MLYKRSILSKETKSGRPIEEFECRDDGNQTNSEKKNTFHLNSSPHRRFIKNNVLKVFQSLARKRKCEGSPSLISAEIMVHSKCDAFNRFESPSYEIL